mmetsp:Transcript_33818/g.37734  ORF Transcript_33818/g.37734 Transcript_33818/m.37734 type:complete len:854 (+) Transcript_33818:68-2629(+)
MPTLMNIPVSHTLAGDKATSIDGFRAEHDGSITLLGDESTIIDEDYRPQNKNNKTEVDHGDELSSPISRVRNDDKSVTFDDSMLIMSGKRGTYSRDDSLHSDVSLSMSYGNTPVKHRHSSVTGENTDNDSYYDCKKNENRYNKSDRVRPWPNRDEYNDKYQTYVKNTVLNFESKFPRKLHDYRSMSLEEKAIEQQNVLGLLSRVGVSKKTLSQSQNDVQSPIGRERLLDETLSPLFSPNPHQSHEHSSSPKSSWPSNLEKNDNEQSLDDSFRLNRSNDVGDKSNLLLSMDGGTSLVRDASNMNDDERNNLPVDNYHRRSDDGVEFPMNNDDYHNNSNNDSNSSMELVRRNVEEPYYSNDEASYETPKDQISLDDLSKKRVATSSGKRGADLQRSRYNEDEEENLTARLGRLSISPSASPPPKDLFVTSQSPISPRLTYQTPDDSEDDAYGGQDEDDGKRISWGRDSGDHDRDRDRRESNTTVDTLATNTPPPRYCDKKEKRRAFREVPVNVSLKQGATFHLEKIPVKRTERLSSKSARSKPRVMAPSHRHRLVNFPDPLVRYGSRSRRVLKEMYTWIRSAERDYEKGECSIPAVGAFFSLSYQQIVDIGLKLLLSDYAELSQFPASQSNRSASMKGNTLVVVRSKDDTATWESALREGTGCSVLNHSTLPLSERIRAATSEKACLHDVVLTTYDAMKSPDVTIPVTKDGRAILTKPGNDSGWRSSRSASQHDVPTHQRTKQLSVLHRITFKRIVFVDTLGRKCYLAKSATARSTASVALSSSSSRLVFFEESEADGSNTLLALRKSDKRAFQSVSSVLHLIDNINDSDMDESSDEEGHDEPLENIAMDFRDLC